MDPKEHDDHSLSKKDEFQEAVEQLFYASPFHEILNSFQKIISDQLQHSSISMNLTEKTESFKSTLPSPNRFKMAIL